jgi:hypothetical protein
MTDIQEIIARWDSGDGKPYKGSLIDWDAYQENPESMGCMCAQGQVLHAVGGWDFAKLRDIAQSEADMETAKLLNISRAHAILLRNINDKAYGAPSIVLTDPGNVLGDQWSKLLDFWWMIHNYSKNDWRNVAAAWAASGVAARNAAMFAAGAAARAAAAWAAARAAAAWAAAWDAVARDAAAWDAVARDAARDAAGVAAGEIQGSAVMAERGQKPFFLPMFDINSLDDIPARPDNYGLGVVPKGGVA